MTENSHKIRIFIGKRYLNVKKLNLFYYCVDNNRRQVFIIAEQHTKYCLAQEMGSKKHKKHKSERRERYEGL